MFYKTFNFLDNVIYIRKESRRQFSIKYLVCATFSITFLLLESYVRCMVCVIIRMNGLVSFAIWFEYYIYCIQIHIGIGVSLIFHTILLYVYTIYVYVYVWF